MSTIFKSALIFCAKSAAFTVIFWVLWIGVLRPASTAASNDSLSAQDAQARAQFEAYEKQVSRVNAQLDVVERQQARMEVNLAAQEENARRFDTVLKMWEKQEVLKK